MRNREFEFSLHELEEELNSLSLKGIKQLFVNSKELSCDKVRLLNFFSKAAEFIPEAFISIKIEPEIIDTDICMKAQSINCSLEIPFCLKEKTDFHEKKAICFFDKKFFSRKTSLLNEAGLIFGIRLFYADVNGDSLKSFRNRIDFAIEQYPNHIDFPQTENSDEAASAEVSAFFSARDIRFARDTAFACRTFYSAGRAVPWFAAVLKPLKIHAFDFFSDFAEWQHCNNCSFRSGFVPEDVPHKEIEKMQLAFLSEKYEEKYVKQLLPLVKDIIRLNGAFSRLTGEREECFIETRYNPNDLFSPEASDIISFHNNVCMEHCRTKIFMSHQGPDYAVC